ncbi:hypothetical protein IP78_13635 [Brevundimonas sp. AAP58]|uniref:hypothetical protein n=1 Tax=Brevundimonas sp. AAP58 TaxID=1523422 RepID=UPI0006B9CC0C|nr:hypothetical protein [Brevundimonas sp. AAP58]KPF75591.1 hypothetical protein IP78_13635 [Brevundimonas sp. AAP58]
MTWAICILAATTFLIHTFIGGPRVAAPLLADTSLPKASKWLNYFCWHIATVLLAFMTGAFAWLALKPQPAVLGPALVFFGALSLVLSVLSAGVAMRGGINPLRFPSTSLFAAIAVVCAFDFNRIV